jgi:hypothetical protein
MSHHAVLWVRKVGQAGGKVEGEDEADEEGEVDEQFKILHPPIPLGAVEGKVVYAVDEEF